MRRDTQHVLLLLLGGALLRIAADDTFLRYVRPSHRPLLVVAGVVMVGLAVVALLRDYRSEHGSGHEPGAGHDHGAVERGAPWLLLAPVLVIALVAPPALGADAVALAGAGNAVVADADVFAPLPPGAVVELSVGEVVQRAAWDRSGSLDGREVLLTGFAVRRGAATDLARLRVYCCAADARVSRVRLDGDVGDLPPDTWVQVRGIVQPGSATAATDFVPALTVTAVRVVPAPSSPYEY
jgi:uncharacterized repeat protein (TIGR03943 family)